MARTEGITPEAFDPDRLGQIDANHRKPTALELFAEKERDVRPEIYVPGIAIGAEDDFCYLQFKETLIKGDGDDSRSANNKH